MPCITKNSYNMFIRELGFISCEIRRKVADIMFIYDLLNGHIHSHELLSMIGFNITSHRLRKVNLFHILFNRYNYVSDSFFPKSLNLANQIVNYVDFFFHVTYYFLIVMYI